MKDPRQSPYRDSTAVEEFVTYLWRNGRSSYTIRTYRFGLEDFTSWAAEKSRPLKEVRRRDVEDYIDAFRRGPKRNATTIDPTRAGQVNPLTRKLYPALERQPRTVNHRLSVLSSFFAYLIARDEEAGPWHGRLNPVPSRLGPMSGSHGAPGRDAVRRGPRAELRQRAPRRLVRTIEPELATDLIETLTSLRDKAIVTLLWRSGQRVGDWSEEHGRHGVLGMALADLDRHSSTILVRLKGARDEHRVPVTSDFWELFERYLAEERGVGDASGPAWVGLRKGHGRPLSYAAFESSLRYASRKLGANVNAHMFRHTLAQALLDTGGLKVAQEVLGHRHLSTTADIYTNVDHQAMLQAMVAARDLFALPTVERGAGDAVVVGTENYVFHYDPLTIDELNEAASWRRP